MSTFNRDNQNPSIEEGQATLWPTEKKKRKRTRINNDLQNTTQKTKERVTRTPLKTNKDRTEQIPLKTVCELCFIKLKVFLVRFQHQLIIYAGNMNVTWSPITCSL